ncbi:hypothetical protein QAD02_014764 [Eretmocerus hayati]|uniref:Uncharacterized protein n=1 Tax=Eretmocerus hayati TaxID=131215 RepID=A0ACC2P6E1_9HYME|nr:hypothetical protein QAD02_014764 [Eretmocerus hayati]
MAERAGRRRSRRDSQLDALHASGVAGGASSTPSRTPPGSKDRRTSRRIPGKPIKERWLLTRKTWRYMADAGRRLIPDSVRHDPSDPSGSSSIPRIEQYFQEVCSKEPRFLLWRKASYPGSLAFRTARRRKHKSGGSCRTKPSSADEADDSRGSSSSVGLPSSPIVSGKLDLAKIKRDWLLSTKAGESNRSSTGSNSSQKSPEQESEAKMLADMLQKYLNMQSDQLSGLTKSPSDSSNYSNSKTTDTTRSISVDHSTGGFAKEPTTSSSSNLDYQRLIEKLEQHLNQIMAEGRRDDATRIYPSEMRSSASASASGFGAGEFTSGTVPRISIPYQSDFVHKSLLETISRYYSKSPNRQHVISDILTDRKLLEKLYFDLRCTRGFRGPRATGAYSSPTARWWNQSSSSRSGRFRDGTDSGAGTSGQRDPGSPPPLIAVQGPSTERGPVDSGIQTDPVSREIIDGLLLEKAKEEQSSPPLSAKEHYKGRRRSSVDNDDVSPSVSDTIKRYLRMARKKSTDSDKADRFKRVNYDRNLRNIKAKGEITKPGDDDGNNKGCQTEDNWMIGYREMSSLEPGEAISDAETTASPVSRNASSRSSIDAGLGSEEAPSTPKHHQSFLSHLLHGSHSSQKDKPHSAPGSPALTSSSSNVPGGGAMQKSKSSSSVVHHSSRLVAKKIFKSRSKSSCRAINLVSAWTPQVRQNHF